MALTDNLVSYWKLDESSGNASDSVGSNTATNNGTATYTAAKINNGIDVNGSSQYFSFATCPQTGSGSFSIAAWVNGDTISSNHCIAGFGTGNTLQGVTFDIRGSKLYADFYASTSVTATTTLSTATWYFVVVTYDGTNLRLYLNTTLDGTSGSVTASIVDGDGAIGRAFWAAGNYFDGRIDEVGMWSRVITGAEMTTLYNGGAGRQYPFSTVNANFLAFM